MATTVIENPILNGPFEEPARHFEFTDDGRGESGFLHLIVEVSAERDEEKEARISTTRNLWFPALNRLGSWGRWGFVEIADPWSCQIAIRSCVLSLRGAAA